MVLVMVSDSLVSGDPEGGVTCPEGVPAASFAVFTTGGRGGGGGEIR